jgi:hypothetical protein
VTELRAADPSEEPLPPIILLAGAGTRDQRTRIAALLAQGQRLDIHGVLLGAWPDGNTVAVNQDGPAVSPPADGDAPTSRAVGRLYTYVSDLRTVLRGEADQVGADLP